MGIFLKGIGIGNKISIGKVFIYEKKSIEVSEEKDQIPYEAKIEKLKELFEEVKRELDETYLEAKKLAPKEAEIFLFHKGILEDKYVLEKIKSYLRKSYSLAYSISAAFYEIRKEFENMEQELFRERAKDIEDIRERVLEKILDVKTFTLSKLPYPCIVIARDLTPSDTANLDLEKILGFVTEEGSRTSHTAILAQALGIPAVLGIKGIISQVSNEEEIIIDSEEGMVILKPSEEEKRAYLLKKEEKDKYYSELLEFKDLPAVTSKGRRIKIFANIGNEKEGELAIGMGAEGVGLFRTEFIFLNRDTPPSEEEQFEVYKKVVEIFKGKTVIIRTLDIGGDKEIPYLNLERENNPFLGVRGIRLCLFERELFKIQLRAILRAAKYGDVWIMYPMVALKREVEEANRILEETKRELEEEGKEFGKNVKVGIMVEVPSIALALEEVINMIDFVSIGSNDLIQYTFAADRTNEKLRYLYIPNHKAMVKLIENVVRVCHEFGKEVGVCGEMAGEEEFVPLLVDLGVDELSMAPSKIPLVKKRIRGL
jgi:phosphotransferase system enzyme I (PtsI)